MNRPSILIVGGDSKVGRSLAAALRQAGECVLCTTRRPGAPPNTIPLDLADAAAWRPPEGVGVAVLAAAMTSMDECRRDPERAARVNVAGTVAVAEALHRSGAFVIYLSSSTVFDGRTPFPTEQDPPSPLNDYGGQKAAAEAGLRQLGEGVAIVRITKLIESIAPLLRQWLQDLAVGKPIEPFADVTVAPIPLASVVSFLMLLLVSRRSGIWQFSGDEDLSYADIARQAVAVAGAPGSLIRPISARASGKVREAIPPRTTMATDAVRREFGIQPPPVRWSVDDALARIWQAVRLADGRAA